MAVKPSALTDFQTGTIPALRALPPEPWGRRFRRARDLSRITNKQVVALIRDIDPHVKVSTATLSRFEHLADVPLEPGQRALAAIACVIYGIDPAELALGLDDVQPRILGRVLEVMVPTKQGCVSTLEAQVGARSPHVEGETAPVIELEARVPAEVAAAKRRHPSVPSDAAGAPGVEWGRQRAARSAS